MKMTRQAMIRKTPLPFRGGQKNAFTMAIWGAVVFSSMALSSAAEARFAPDSLTIGSPQTLSGDQCNNATANDMRDAAQDAADQEARSREEIIKDQSVTDREGSCLDDLMTFPEIQLPTLGDIMGGGSGGAGGGIDIMSAACDIAGQARDSVFDRIQGTVDDVTGAVTRPIDAVTRTINDTGLGNILNGDPIDPGQVIQNIPGMPDLSPADLFGNGG